MADLNDDLINQLKEIASSLDKIRTEDLIRPKLGPLSLESFAPDFERLKSGLGFAITYSSRVHRSNIQDYVNIYQSIATELVAQAGRADQDYANVRDTVLNHMRSHIEELKQYSPPFVTAAIMSRGFLDDEGVRKEYERTVQELKTEAKKSLGEVEQRSREIISRAKETAAQIERRARTTASGTSVEEAQKQFREAQPLFDKKVMRWGGLSILCSVAFIGVVLYFAAADPPEKLDWTILYYTAIRITILTAIGAATAFCLKIFRAHLHMSEKNRHRQRVANSIGAFVESAVTPEQRDLILSQLVESVVQFGNSGLLQGKADNLYRPKMTIDSITKTISGNSSKD